METIGSVLLAVYITLTGFLGVTPSTTPEPTFGLSILRPAQGGTGVGTAAPSDVGKVLKVSDDSPFTYTLQDDNTGAGGSFPFTPTSWGNSTSTVLGLLGGVFSNASSTFHILKAGSASTTNLVVSSLNTANCDVKASSDGTLSCGTDATGGGGGGSGNVATSSSETSGRVPFWTSTGATPATLSGGVAGFAWNDTFKRLTATYSSSTALTATNIYGTLTGNADTATALSADPANCSAGNAPLGIVATGAVEGCFDVWTEAENTSAGYVAGTRALTIAGTANQITSSAGSQTLAADRTWTLSLPSHVIFPSSFVASLSSTTHSTTTWLTTHRLAGDASDGILLEANNGTDVAILGAGNSANSLFYGGVNIDGSTRLATSLTGLLRADSGTVSVATAGVDYANFAYPFTPATNWFSTSTISLNTAGLISTASSSIAFLDSVRSTSTSLVATNATTSALSVSSVLSFGGVAGDAWTDFCVSITGSAALCDGNDASGTGGAAAVATSSSETSGYIPFWTTTSGTPAQLSGGESTFTYSSALDNLTVQNASTTLLSADTIYPNVSGGIVLDSGAGVIELNGADIQFFGSGSYKFWSGTGTIDAFFDATGLTTADKTFTFPDASGTLTLGTGSTGNCASWSSTNVLTTTGVPCGSGGNTDTVLWANASTSPWSVLSLNANSSSSIAFLSMTRATSTDFISTNATTTVLSASSHIRSSGTVRVDNLTSALIITGSTGLLAEYTGTSCTNQFVRSIDALGVATCATVGATDVSLANLTATDTTLTFSGTYTGATARTIGLNLGNANAWTALQTFNTSGIISLASSTITFLDSTRATSTDFINTNATSSVTSVSTHLRSVGTTRLDNMTSALLLTGSTGLVAEYTGTTCTNQVMTVLSVLGVATCTTITSAYVDSSIATFAFPFTPATSWTATSTLMLNTGGYISVASSTFSLLNTDNISISSTGSLLLPTNADPVVNVAGEIALDTTSGNIVFATSTAQELILGGATTTLYAMVIASTSPDFASGGVIPLPTHFLKQQAVGVICKVDSGTSQQIFLSDSASTNDTNTITCSTTETQYNFTTNNIWIAYEPIQLEFATKSGSPDYITIRIVGFRTSD